MKAFDPLGALRTLVAWRVDFVVIGGLAARLHGSPSITDDLDICHSKEPQNLERLASALKEMNARLRGAPPDVPFLLDAKTLAKGDNFTFITEHGPLDCLAHPSGVGGYESLAPNATRIDLGDVTVAICSLEDLMAMKKSAGRPADLIELEILAALAEEIEKEER